jgi:hypothetical protein
MLSGQPADASRIAGTKPSSFGTCHALLSCDVSLSGSYEKDACEPVDVLSSLRIKRDRVLRK